MSFQTSSDEHNANYLLSRGALSSARLTYQHQLFVARQGFILHPTISAALGLSGSSSSNATQPRSHTSKDKIQILDLATGNGIWAIDLNALYPPKSSARPIKITCLDINPSQFPPRATWPPNTTFSTYNIFADPPSEYVSQFDVVHIKFIVAVLWQDDTRASTALGNVVKMLKPGGWIQWCEPPPPSFARVILPAKDDGTCDLANEMQHYMAVFDKYVPVQTKSQWLNHLDEFIANFNLSSSEDSDNDGKSFTDVEARWAPMRPERAKYETDLCVWSTEEVLSGMQNIPGMSEEGKKDIEESWRAFAAKLERGEKVVACRILTVVGRKVVA